MTQQKHKAKGRRLFRKWKELSFGRKVWRVAWVTAVAVWLFTVLQVLFCAVFNPPLTPLMVQQHFRQRKDKNAVVRFERDYVPIEDISPHLVTAVVAAEDGLFLYHHGFDVKQLRQARRENKAGRRMRGGSTISMQTAKNCFLPHKRTMLRKVVEAYYTVMIEAIWSKERIMECYLNIVEFGDGIYGCEAAAQHYFHHSAAQLSRREAAQLAATLPAPRKRNPDHPSAYFNKRTATIQNLMAKYGNINLRARREDLNPKYLKQVEDERMWDFVWEVISDR